MTLIHVFPPIALATVLNIWAFYFAWKWSKLEDLTGVTPWRLIFLILLYSGTILSFMYFHGFEKDIEGYFPIFFTALIGEGLGALIMFGLVPELFKIKTKETTDKFRTIISILFFALIVFSPLLID